MPVVFITGECTHTTGVWVWGQQMRKEKIKPKKRPVAKPKG